MQQARERLIFFVAGTAAGLGFLLPLLHPKVMWYDNGLTTRWVDTRLKKIWLVIDESKNTRLPPKPDGYSYRIVRVYKPGWFFGLRGKYLSYWNGRGYPIFGDDSPLPPLPSKISTQNKNRFDAIRKQDISRRAWTQKTLTDVKSAFRRQSVIPRFYFLPPQK